MKNTYYNKVKTIKIHKQRFDSINKKADYIILQCIENGKVLKLKRLDKRENKNIKNVVIQHVPEFRIVYKRNDFILDLKLKNYDVSDIEELPTTAFVVSSENIVLKEIRIICEIIDDYTLKIIPSDDADIIAIRFFYSM